MDVYAGGVYLGVKMARDTINTAGKAEYGLFMCFAVVCLLVSIGIVVAEEGDPSGIISINRNYTKSCNASVGCPDASYPDTNNVELTDGIYANNGYLDTNWTGFGTLWYEPVFFVNVTIDLGSTRLIGKINSTYLDGAGSVQHPSNVEYFCGNDSYYFVSLGNGTLSSVNGIAIFPLGGLNASCRYIKTIAVRGGDYWIFIDEIEVWNRTISPKSIQYPAGNINIAPKGKLKSNVTHIQMRKPNGNWSCCGSDNYDAWGCAGGEC